MHFLLKLFGIFLFAYPTTSVIVSHWSLWRPCVGMPRCRQRVRVCAEPDDLTIPLILCRHGNMSRDDKIYNCQSCNGTWEFLQTLVECGPSCYNSSRTVISRCSSNISCLLQSVVPCNTPSLCTGSWVADKAGCSASCNDQGMRKLSYSCVKDGKPSIACPDSYGFNRKIVHEMCNATCRSWSGWTGSGVCSVSCGNGTHVQSRNCVEAPVCAGHNGSSYVGDESTHEPCNTHSCPTWTQWSTSGRCHENVLVWKRSCVYKQQPYRGCSGNSSFENYLSSCNSTDPLTGGEPGSNTLPLYFIIVVSAVGALCLLLLVICVMLCVKLSSTNRVIKSLNKKGFETHRNYESIADVSEYQTEVSTITLPPTPFKMPIQDENDSVEKPVHKYRSKSLKVLSENSNSAACENNYQMATLPRKNHATLENMKERAQSMQVNEGMGSKGNLHRLDEPLRPRPSVRRAERLKEKRERKLSKKLENTDQVVVNEDPVCHPSLQKRSQSEGDILSPKHNMQTNNNGARPHPKPRKPVRKQSSMFNRLDQHVCSVDDIAVGGVDVAAGVGRWVFGLSYATHCNSSGNPTVGAK